MRSSRKRPAGLAGDFSTDAHTHYISVRGGVQPHSADAVNGRREPFTGGMEVTCSQADIRELTSQFRIIHTDHASPTLLDNHRQ